MARPPAKITKTKGTATVIEVKYEREVQSTCSHTWYLS